MLRTCRIHSFLFAGLQTAERIAAVPFRVHLALLMVPPGGFGGWHHVQVRVVDGFTPATRPVISSPASPRERVRGRPLVGAACGRGGAGFQPPVLHQRPRLPESLDFTF